MVDTSITCWVYTATYNCGQPHCRFIYIYIICSFSIGSPYVSSSFHLRQTDMIFLDIYMAYPIKRLPLDPIVFYSVGPRSFIYTPH